MAVTQGHGNPNWTRDETILALDLYLKSSGGSEIAHYGQNCWTGIATKDWLARLAADRGFSI
jgi:hypothetical protein